MVKVYGITTDVCEFMCSYLRGGAERSLRAPRDPCNTLEDILADYSISTSSNTIHGGLLATFCTLIEYKLMMVMMMMVMVVMVMMMIMVMMVMMMMR